MKSNLKSSITLPLAELKLVEMLKKKTAAKSNVEVVRRGLRLLESSLNREELKEKFRLASKQILAAGGRDSKDLDQLAGDALSDED